MGTLSYPMSISLDGYIEDVTGGIAFSAPDEEVHRFANEQTRETAAFLFGRGLYEVMEEFWTAPERADGGEVEAEFAREYAATPRAVRRQASRGRRSSTLADAKWRAGSWRGGCGRLLTGRLIRDNEDGGQGRRSGSRPSAGSSSESGCCQGSELSAGSSSIACTGVSVGCAGSAAMAQRR
jgi:hypothetical protein